jgi:hypothetical protein
MMFFIYIQHKCASGWLNRVFSTAAKAEKLHFMCSESFAGDFLSTAKYKRNDVCLISNGDASKDILDPTSKGVHVFRDPRDILISAYFSHKNSHSVEGWPELVEHRKKLNNSSLKDGLELEMEFCEGFYNILRSWNLNEKNVIQMRMEDITKDITELKRVFKFFGWQKALGDSESIWEQFSFKNLSGGRKQGQEDSNHHWRKGVSGDWVNYFDDIKDTFKEKYGDIVIKYGYEQNNNW